MPTAVRRDPAKAPRPLTPRSIDALTSGKLFDRGVTPGLYLLVLPSGSKVWRLKYSIGGKERLAALGSWPEVSIDEARLRAGNARKLIDKGMNPTEAERAARTAAADAARYTFGMACAEWLDWVKAQGKSEKTTQKAEWIVKLLRPLHARPVGEITTKELFSLIRRYEEAGKRETAHRMKSVAQRVFDRAAVSGHVETNPARLIGRQLLPVQAQSHAGITDPYQFGMLMRLIDSRGYGSGFTVENALMLLARVFVRPGELRQMRWSEIKDLDGDEPLWVIPAERMKMRRPHVVPLSVQAANIIREQSIVSDHSEYVFPGGRSSRRPLSDGALGAALKSLLVSSDVHVPHGFRVSASTLLREIGFESELVELQLAHRTGNAVASIYDRSERLPERRKMMQRWSDYIEECKELKLTTARTR